MGVAGVPGVPGTTGVAGVIYVCGAMLLGPINPGGEKGLPAFLQQLRRVLGFTQ